MTKLRSAITSAAVTTACVGAWYLLVVSVMFMFHRGTSVSYDRLALVPLLILLLPILPGVGAAGFVVGAHSGSIGVASFAANVIFYVVLVLIVKGRRDRARRGAGRKEDES